MNLPFDIRTQLSRMEEARRQTQHQLAMIERQITRRKQCFNRCNNRQWLAHATKTGLTAFSHFTTFRADKMHTILG